MIREVSHAWNLSNMYLMWVVPGLFMRFLFILEWYGNGCC